MLYDREVADMDYEDAAYDVQSAIRLFNNHEISFSNLCNELSDVAKASTLNLCTNYATGKIDQKTLITQIMGLYIKNATNNTDSHNSSGAAFESFDSDDLVGRSIDDYSSSIDPAAASKLMQTIIEFKVGTYTFAEFCRKMSAIAGTDMTDACTDYINRNINRDELIDAAMIDRTVDIDSITDDSLLYSNEYDYDNDIYHDENSDTLSRLKANSGAFKSTNPSRNFLTKDGRNTFESIEDDGPISTSFIKSRRARNPAGSRLDALTSSAVEMKTYSPAEIELSSTVLEKLQAAYPNSRNWFRTFRKQDIAFTVYQPYSGDKLSRAVDEFESYIKSLGGHKKITGTGNISYHIPKQL